MTTTKTTPVTNAPAVQAAQADFKTGISKAQDMYLSMIDKQFLSHGMRLSEYQKTCAISAIYAIQAMLDKKSIRITDLDQTGLTGILQTVAALELNASAIPREVYFSVRSEKRGDIWIQKLEMGIEGDGNDALLRRFGVDVKKVGRPWLVRSGDEFSYPVHRGIELTPPEWGESGIGPIVRVVYPVQLTDGSVEYLIQEREDVRANLLAHLSNNLMNETFGQAESRYKASTEQKKVIDAKKAELLAVAKGLSLEEILDNETLSPFISPAWTEPQSREAMIIRKMRNNAVKKYPKDFGSSFTSERYNEMDDSYRDAQSEVNTNMASEMIDITPPFQPQGDPVENPAIPEKTPPTEFEEPSF